MTTPERAPRNKTLTLTDTERRRLALVLDAMQPSTQEKHHLQGPAPAGAEEAETAHENAHLERLAPEHLYDRILNHDLFSLLPRLPAGFADLVIIDPPYNLDKDFHGSRFRAMKGEDYAGWLAGWLPGVLACAKEGASVYLCGDWKCSGALEAELAKHAVIRNRITWQREKGRGAARNWKNCSEDIWFATIGEGYHFDVEAVMQRRRVLAPYRQDGLPKDWQEEAEGRFRLTHPSNLWDDITVPYWSMSENTDHPTQKPEKLIAKLILASSRPGDLVFDPFAGSGTTAVTARKLGRRFCTVEQNREYCLWALKRLELAEADRSIQGYKNGVFLGRNAE